MNPAVDTVLEDAPRWNPELQFLRALVLQAPLVEEVKWGQPCYTHEGRNILILQEMKDVLAVMFFKGALLSDPEGVLEDQGPNSRSARRICFISGNRRSNVPGYRNSSLGFRPALSSVR